MLRLAKIYKIIFPLFFVLLLSSSKENTVKPFDYGKIQGIVVLHLGGKTAVSGTQIASNLASVSFGINFNKSSVNPGTVYDRSRFMKINRKYASADLNKIFDVINSLKLKEMPVIITDRTRYEFNSENYICIVPVTLSKKPINSMKDNDSLTTTYNLIQVSGKRIPGDRIETTSPGYQLDKNNQDNIITIGNTNEILNEKKTSLESNKDLFAYCSIFGARQTKINSIDINYILNFKLLARNGNNSIIQNGYNNVATLIQNQ